MGKRILYILKHVIFPAKIQISKSIDVSIFIFDLKIINMSSECQYDWHWKISASSTEYEACDSFASLTRLQSSYSGSACWYFRYQSIHIQITYTYRPKNIYRPGSIYIYRSINIDYYMAFFITYPLSARGHDISPRADRLKGWYMNEGW